MLAHINRDISRINNLQKKCIYPFARFHHWRSDYIDKMTGLRERPPFCFCYITVIIDLIFCNPLKMWLMWLLTPNILSTLHCLGLFCPFWDFASDHVWRSNGDWLLVRVRPDVAGGKVSPGMGIRPLLFSHCWTIQGPESNCWSGNCFTEIWPKLYLTYARFFSNLEKSILCLIIDKCKREL